MDTLKTSTTNLKDHISQYAQTGIQLAKLKATKAASNTAAGVAIGVTVLVLGLFCLGFLLTALAWWLTTVFANPALGFLCVAGLLLLSIVLLFALRRKVIVPLIRNAIIGAVYDNKND